MGVGVFGEVLGHISSLGLRLIKKEPANQVVRNKNEGSWKPNNI